MSYSEGDVRNLMAVYFAVNDKELEVNIMRVR